MRCGIRARLCMHRSSMKSRYRAKAGIRDNRRALGFQPPPRVSIEKLRSRNRFLAELTQLRSGKNAVEMVFRKAPGSPTPSPNDAPGGPHSHSGRRTSPLDDLLALARRREPWRAADCADGKSSAVRRHRYGSIILRGRSAMVPLESRDARHEQQRFDHIRRRRSPGPRCEDLAYVGAMPGPETA